MPSNAVGIAQAILAQELRAGLIHDLAEDHRLRRLVEKLKRKVPKSQPWLWLEMPPGGWREDPAFLKSFTFQDEVNCIAVASNAAPSHRRNWIFVGLKNDLAVIDIDSGKELRRFKGHSGPIKSVALSADGSRAVSGSWDHTVRVWDIETGRCLHVLQGHSEWVDSVALSADGTRAVSGSWDHTVRVWDTETGRCLDVLKGHFNFVGAVALSADGTRGLSGPGEGSLHVWNLRTGECLRILERHSGAIYSVALSADGTCGLSGSLDDTVRFWNLDTGKCLRILKGHSGDVKAVALSAEGTRALSGSEDYTVRVWNLNTGECLRVLEGHCHHVTTVALSADGTRVLSGSRDCTVRVWDLSTGECLSSLEGHSEQVKAVAQSAQSADRIRVLSGSYGSLKLWNAESGECLRMLPGRHCEVFSVALSADGTRALTACDDYTVAEIRGRWQIRDFFIRVWNTETGQCVRVLKGHSYDITAIALSADGTRALSASNDNTSIELRRSPYIPAFSVRFWDIGAGECLRTFEGHSKKVFCVALSADGTRALSSAADGTARVWNPHTGECINIIEDVCVTAAVLSADGTRAIGGSFYNKTVGLWNTETGECLQVFEGHSGGISAVALGADHTRALTGSRDCTMRVWDIRGGKCLAAFECPGPVRAVQWLPKVASRIISTCVVGSQGTFRPVTFFLELRDAIP